MPIRPIDLQTLLMQMAQVGRDQAIEKDAPALQSALQGAAAKAKDLEAKEGVKKAEDSKEGPMPVKDRRSRGHEARGEGEEGKGTEEADSEEKGRDEVVRDPSLGNRVDLSG